MVGNIELIDDTWLANILNRPVYRLNFDPVGDDFSTLKKMIYQAVQNVEGKEIFIHTRVPTVSLMSCRVVEALGFELMDTNVVFDKPAESKPHQVEPFILQFAQKSHHEACRKLAGSCFDRSRFHLDPKIPNELANCIMSEWAGNFFAGGRGEWMVVALSNTEVVGFLQLLRRGTDTLLVDLIGVDSNYRRQGIAEAMIRFAERECKRFVKVIVGTQVANISSVRLYERLGFRIRSSQYIYHYHGI